MRVEIAKGEIVSTNVEPGMTAESVTFEWRDRLFRIDADQFKLDFARM